MWIAFSQICKSSLKTETAGGNNAPQASENDQFHRNTNQCLRQSGINQCN
jgi:hypothetical protein